MRTLDPKILASYLIYLASDASAPYRAKHRLQQLTPAQAESIGSTVSSFMSKQVGAENTRAVDRGVVSLQKPRDREKTLALDKAFGSQRMEPGMDEPDQNPASRTPVYSYN